MSTGGRDIAGARRPARRRGALRGLLLAILAMVLCQAPASAPAQVAPNRLDGDRATLATALQAYSHLPAGRLNTRYGSARVVYGGTPPYALDPQSQTPPGLHLTPTGFLEGAPTQVGPNVLMFIVRDSAQPAHVTQGLYILNVLPPRPPPKVTPPPVKPAPVLPVVQPAETPPAPAGKIALWSLSQGDLIALATVPPPVAEDPPPPVTLSPDPKPPAPGERSPPAVDATSFSAPPPLSADQQERLKVLVNLEYPTLALFKSALHARLDDVPKASGTLPEATVDMIARQSFKPQDFAHAPRPLLKDLASCGCVPAQPAVDARTTYGFFPFWRPTTAAQAVNFSLFDRIEILGVQIKPDGSWLKPGNRNQPDDDWSKDMGRLAVAAQSHGSRLDLVLHGADWDFLRTQSDDQLSTFARNAAKSAMTLAGDTKPTGLEPVFHRFLVKWMWGTRRSSAFDGVTVMFQPPEGATKAAFDRFFELFIGDLADQINERGERFTLNIVVPYDPDVAAKETLFRPGAFDWKKILAYSHLQKRDQKPPLSDEELTGYSDKSHLYVRFLVLMPSRTSPSKKSLRSEIDRIENFKVSPYNIQGHARVTLTNEIIPIVLDPSGAAPAPMANALATGGSPTAPPGVNDAWVADAHKPQTGAADESDSLAMDMIYHQQNFGGAALWPLPIGGVDAGPYVQEQVAKIFFADRKIPFLKARVSTLIPICSTFLRLLFQLLIVALVVAPIVYVNADLAQKDRDRLLGAIFGIALLTAALGFTLLNLDPALDRVKSGNVPFLVTLAVMAAVVGWQYKKPRIRRP